MQQVEGQFAQSYNRRQHPAEPSGPTGLPVLGGATVEEFRANYQPLIETRLAKDSMARQPEWTESIAVGSQAFVEAMGQRVIHRQQLRYGSVGENTWVLREGPLPPWRETA